MPTVQDEPAALQRFGHDLTAQARAGRFPPLEGYEPWVSRVLGILLRPPNRRYNPALVGLSDAEGWPIVAEVVRRIACGEVPEGLCVRQVVALDWEALVGDIPDLGEPGTSTEAQEHRFYAMENLQADEALWQTVVHDLHESVERRRANPLYQRLEAVFAAARRCEEQVLLYVEQMHRLLGGEWERYPVDVVRLLKPALAHGELRILGTCSLDAYHHSVEQDAAMQPRFQEVCSRELSGYLGPNGV